MNENKKRNNLSENAKKIWNTKSYRILIISVSILLVLIIAAIIAVNPILENYVKPKILHTVNDDPSNRYSLRMGDLEYHLWSNGISADKILFTFADDKQGIDSLKMEVPYVEFQGIDWLGLFLGNKQIDLNAFKIDSARFYIHTSGNSKKNKASNSRQIKVKFASNRNAQKSSEDSSNSDENWGKQIKNTIAESLPKRILPLTIDKVEITSAKIIRYNKKNGQKDSLTSITLNLDKLILKTTETNLKLIFMEDFELKAKNIFSHMKESNYNFSISNLNISSKENKIEIDSINLKPFLSDSQFFSGKKYRTDRYIVKIPHLNLAGVEFAEILRNNNIKANKITLKNSLFNVLTDKSLPLDPKTNPDMPQQIMKKLKYDIDIKNIHFDGGKIFIESKYDYAKEYAKIFFTGIDVAINNFTTNKKLQTDNTPTTIRATGKMVDAAILHLNIDLPILSNGLDVSYYGYLEKMEVTKLNSQLAIANKVKITSGIAERSDYSVRIEDGHATGKVKPIYHNLKLEKLNGYAKEGGIWQDLQSFFANTFVIRSDNPKNNEDLKVGKVDYTTIRTDTFMDVIWKSVKGGLGRVVGFK